MRLANAYPAKQVACGDSPKNPKYRALEGVIAGMKRQRKQSSGKLDAIDKQLSLLTRTNYCGSIRM